MAKDLFQNKYRISSHHIPNWDYSSRAYYFVTICTAGREHYFGTIKVTQNSASLLPTPIGQIAIDNWLDIPKHFPFVVVEDFVVMPEHIHGSLFFQVPDKAIYIPNRFGPQSRNLASVIRGYKGSVKTYATKNGINFNWHPRYFNSIVFKERDLLQ
jgi:putative transposase